MPTKLIARVTLDKKLEISPEFQEKLEPLTEYEVTITENEIKLKKTTSELTLDEIRRRVDALGPDPNQPTLEEISKIVKEVRYENWAKNQGNSGC